MRYPALPDIRQGNLVSGRIQDIKKGRIIRPAVHSYFTPFSQDSYLYTVPHRTTGINLLAINQSHWP
jgi:hypothetical protein